jgi:hypothetical protein
VASGLTLIRCWRLLRLGGGDLNIDVGDAARRRREHFVRLVADEVKAR